MKAAFSKPDHCKTCLGWAWPDKGYVPASGTGANGVLIVAEAAGEHEAEEGMPLVGKAGYYLFQQLARMDIEREGFRLHNVLSCRPPNNFLAKAPYEAEAIERCSPLLDATIYDMKARCKETGKTMVILTLGRIPFKRIMGLTDKSPMMRYDYLCYPHWSDRYNCWVIAADHPSYLMRGNNHLVPLLQFSVKRALEIAENGLRLDETAYTLDPSPDGFQQWVNGFLKAYEKDPTLILSYDIETPYKQDKSEEDLAKEEGEDYIILRVSFSYGAGVTVSIPWSAAYLAGIEQLFASEVDKLGWNSDIYDRPRVMSKVTMNGVSVDGMVAWHILNSALPKGLGFVTPFYNQTTSMWKHLSDDQPAFYNAKDAHMALTNYMGIREDLKKNALWPVYDRHVLRLNEALTYMTGTGVILDQEMRHQAETELAAALDEAEKAMEVAVPPEARKVKIWKKVPAAVKAVIEASKAAGRTLEEAEGDAKIATGLFPLIQPLPLKVCGVCGEIKPGKKHASMCGGVVSPLDFPTQVWGQHLEFKISKVGLSSYQTALRHQAIHDRKQGKISYNEESIMKLMKHYPKDPLYPKILEYRGLQKLLSTYIGVTQSDGRIRGGMPVGKDGRIHTVYSHNPSTLRLASQDPNLQNLPRGNKDESDPVNIIRRLVMAQAGSILLARDFSGIEAVLVGYFAAAPRYIRLAKIDVHSFYTAYALNALDGRVKTCDLPDLGWEDDRLKSHLAAIKKEFSWDRNTLYKHLIHGANFMQSAKGAQEKIFKETGQEFPVGMIQKVMGVYFELFPEIPRWHTSTLLQAEKDGFLRNPFGYVHRFHSVFSYTKFAGEWTRKPGTDSNRAIAFLPQSTAAGMIKEAIIRLYFERFEEAGQYLRLQVHDEIMLECPIELTDKVDDIVKEEMERPVPELALPESYGMGKYLSILTEAKRGPRWGSMR